MKKLVLLLTATTCILCSCQKDLYNPEQTIQDPKMTDLVIPTNFDWKMTQKVESKLSSPADTRVSVYTDSKCENKIAEYTVQPSNETPIVFNVPSHMKELYVKPEGQSVQSVKIADGSINQVLTPSRTTRADADESKWGYNEFYSDWHTVMFEDMFPKLGDYDFNDFVANYKYTTIWESKNNPKLMGITIDVRINAIGGNLPFSPYLRIEGLNSANKITSISPAEKVERIYKGVDNGNKSITLKLKNLKFAPKPNEFINTKADQPIEDPEVISITIDFENGGNNENQVGALGFDFFLANNNGIEIHQKGKKPVLEGNIYPSEIEGGKATDEDATYSNGKNYVWAIEIPGQIHHTIEKANFVKAYTGFASWATSGGTANPKWYEAPSVKDLIVDLSDFWKK